MTFYQQDEGSLILLSTVFVIPLFALGLVIMDFCYMRSALQSLQQAADLACLSGATVADENAQATKELTEHVFALNAPSLKNIVPEVTVRSFFNRPRSSRSSSPPSSPRSFSSGSSSNSSSNRRSSSSPSSVSSCPSTSSEESNDSPCQRRVEICITYEAPAMVARIFGSYFSFFSSEIHSAAIQKRDIHNHVQAVLVR